MAKKLTSLKAREILHDKSVHGHPLTDKQRRFFGAIAGGAEPMEEGGWLEKYAEGGLIGPKAAPITLDGTEVFEHGEDTSTAKHKENGVKPTDLTKKGQKYAERVGMESAKRGKTDIISSGIERVQQTADIIANVAGAEREVNSLLNTWNIGDYDGKKAGSFKEKDWAKKGDKAPKNGESFNSFAQRMEQAYDYVKNAPPTDEVITHSKVTRAFKALANTDGIWTPNTTKQFLDLKDKKAKDGLVLKKKTKDNYGTTPNANEGHSTAGPGWIGEGTTNVGFDYNGAWGGTMQMGGSLPGSVGFMYARTQNPAPANGKYTKKTQASAQNGQEMKYWQDGLDFKPKSISKKGKKIIKDDMGQWAHPGEITEIGSPDITMQGVDYPVLGISDTGDTQMMYPDQDYKFDGKKVTEYPMAQDGKIIPKAYWASNEQREEYRNKLKEIGKKALQEGSDENFLLETPYHKIDDGNNCINGVCGLNTAAGLKYSNPADIDRYLGNSKFSDAVKQGKEDYYQVSGNFQIGDHLQYLNDKGAPHHSKMIYDITTDDRGNKEYHVIHNSGGKTFTENVYSEADMKDMLSGKMPLTASNYSKINIYRPGYSLDKPAIDKEREAKTSPEAREALARRKEIQDWDATHDPRFEYSIRPESEYYKDQPEGMKKFIAFANDDAKVTELAKKLNVSKDIIHGQLLNTFGELGQENKWADRWFGGDYGVENTFEKIFSPGNMSIGPGQIKYNTIDPELREKFGIKRRKDLHDIEKVIPLMTAINVRNKQYMERLGEDLSTKLVGTPGTSADEIKYGIDRWVPYMYRGTITDPIAPVRKRAEENAGQYRFSKEDREKYINKYINENVDPEALKMFAKGSYAERVYDMIDKNLKRTMPAENFEKYNELMPITVKSKKKEAGGWLNKYK